MTAALVAVTFFATALLGVVAGRAAYRNGFWDGALWERERDGRMPPPHTCKPAADSGICIVCGGPGGESPYPSKPGPSWHGWESLRAGARQRKALDPDGFAAGCVCPTAAGVHCPRHPAG